jgi:hypothetical protein
MKKLITALLTAALLIADAAYANDDCKQDALGNIYCAYGGGVVVETLDGLACSNGKCIKDEFGEWLCAKSVSGGIIKDDLGKAVCVGGCEKPNASMCNLIKK